jgi:hypothetical protein
MRTEYEIKNKCEDNLEFRIKKKNQIHRKKKSIIEEDKKIKNSK